MLALALPLLLLVEAEVEEDRQRRFAFVLNEEEAMAARPTRRALRVVGRSIGPVRVARVGGCVCPVCLCPDLDRG